MRVYAQGGKLRKFTNPTLTFINTFDLDDINIVERAAGLRTVPLLENRLIYKIRGFHRRFEEFTAIKGKLGLLEGHRGALQNDRLKARFLDLIDIAAALRAAKLKNVAELFLIEGKRQTVFALDEVMSITRRTDEDERDRLVPKPADSTPGGGHRVELLLIAGSDQHPLLADEVKRVFLRQNLDICFFHIG